jgi:hypothetical protein
LEDHRVPDESVIELFRLSDAIYYPELRLIGQWKRFTVGVET